MIFDQYVLILLSMPPDAKGANRREHHGHVDASGTGRRPWRHRRK
jgi:hypothetical protein